MNIITHTIGGSIMCNTKLKCPSYTWSAIIILLYPQVIHLTISLEKAFYLWCATGTYTDMFCWQMAILIINWKPHLVIEISSVNCGFKMYRSLFEPEGIHFHLPNNYVVCPISWEREHTDETITFQLSFTCLIVWSSTHYWGDAVLDTSDLFQRQARTGVLSPMAQYRDSCSVHLRQFFICHAEYDFVCCRASILLCRSQTIRI